MEQPAIQKFLRSEISFYVTIVVTVTMWVVSIMGVYYGITNKFDLLTQKVEIHIASTQNMPSVVADLKEKVAVLMAKAGS